jgi:hypothetical protein
MIMPKVKRGPRRTPSIGPCNVWGYAISNDKRMAGFAEIRYTIMELDLDAKSDLQGMSMATMGVR